MQYLKALVLCCLLVAATAGGERGRGNERRRGANRFFGGNSFGGSFPGSGIHNGNVFNSAGIPGSGLGGLIGGGVIGGGLVSGGGSRGPSTCRYWCKTPENQNYCCETVYEPEGPVGTKQLDCPDVRPTCPVNTRFGPPVTCSSDYKCGGADKCCFDRCLGEHVCKPPSVFGGSFLDLVDVRIKDQ